MIVPILSYSSVNAKTRALFGKLLSKQDYDELLAKRTVPEVAAYIKKNTDYGAVLSGINENLVHRGELEKLFKASLFDDFIKIFRFLPGGSKEFLKAAFLRYEVEDLKMLFRVVFTNRESEAVLNSLVFLKKYSRLDFNKLAGSSSLLEVVSNLKGSEYYNVLSHFSDNFTQPSLFDIEMSLDLHFFMSILKLKDKLLSGEDHRSVTQTFGVEIDLLNILMIYRCKKLFKFPAELTFKYVIPHWHRLTREQLIGLAQSRDMEEFKRLVTVTRYAGVFKKDEEHLWETNVMNFTHRMFKSHFRRDSFNFGMSIAYLHLKDIDIKNIITLIEGIRYSLPKDEIKSYLLGIRL
ncbi:MAG: V-type ATPase subunit [Clostridia bacterium]|nr:V-type ATPase subunit [Clostridia bacterium]